MSTSPWNMKPSKPLTIIVEGTPILFKSPDDSEQTIGGKIIDFDLSTCFYYVRYRHPILGSVYTHVRETNIIAMM